MKKWVLWTVLAASLSFNLLFLVAFGAARAQSGRPLSPEVSARWLTRQLDLSDEQRRAYLDYRHRLDEHRARVAERYSGRTEQYWSVMASPNPDADVSVRAAVEAAQDARVEIIDYETEALREFLSTLNPEQRREFVGIARRWLQRSFGVAVTRS